VLAGSVFGAHHRMTRRLVRPLEVAPGLRTFDATSGARRDGPEGREEGRATRLQQRQSQRDLWVLPQRNGARRPPRRGRCCHLRRRRERTGSQTISRNGTIVTASRTDTYDVGADCTGRLIDATGLEFARFVVVDRGNEIFQISLAAGNAVTGVQRKLHRGHDEHDED
jgi:hypothetical protein